MTFFGETLRKAREAKGLTSSQVADRTHILVQIIEAMEREDFKRIPAAIYGRGFIRHIAEVLEIDPKPLVSEFMEIYEGRKAPASQARDPFQPLSPSSAPAAVPVAPPPIIPAEVAPAAETPVAEESAAEEPTPAPQPNVVEGLDLFNQPPPVVERGNARQLWTGNDVQPVISNDVGHSTPPAAPVPPLAPPITRAQDIFSSSYRQAADEIPLGPSAAEKFRESLSVVSHGVIGTVRRIPRSAWRMAVLVIGAVAVIGLLAWGCKILYQITEQPADTAANPVSAQSAKAPASQPAAKPTAAKPAALRTTGQKIPPLYVD